MTQLHYLTGGAYGAQRNSPLPGQCSLVMLTQTTWEVRRFTWDSWEAAAAGTITMDVIASGTSTSPYNVGDWRQRADGTYLVLLYYGNYIGRAILDPTAGTFNVLGMGQFPAATTWTSVKFLTDTTVMAIDAKTGRHDAWAMSVDNDGVLAVDFYGSMTFRTWTTGSGQSSTMHPGGRLDDDHLLLLETYRQYDISSYLRAQAWILRHDGAGAVTVAGTHDVDTTSDAFVTNYFHIVALGGGTFMYHSRAGNSTPFIARRLDWEAASPGDLVVGDPVTVNDNASGQWGAVILTAFTNPTEVLIGYVDYNAEGSRFVMLDDELNTVSDTSYPISEKPWVDTGALVHPDGFFYGLAFASDWSSVHSHLVRPPVIPEPPTLILTARPRSQNVRFG